MKSLFIILISLVVASGCSRKHIDVIYKPDSKNTGTIVIKPVKKTKKTYVLIDGNLIVDSKKVKSVTIHNVPAGNHIVQYNSDNQWYKYPIDSTYNISLDTSQTVTKIVKNPPYSTGYYIYISSVVIGMVIYSIFAY